VPVLGRNQVHPVVSPLRAKPAEEDPATHEFLPVPVRSHKHTLRDAMTPEIAGSIDHRDEIDVVGPPPAADIEPNSAVPVSLCSHVSGTIEPPIMTDRVVESRAVQVPNNEWVDLVRAGELTVLISLARRKDIDHPVGRKRIGIAEPKVQDPGGISGLIEEK